MTPRKNETNRGYGTVFPFFPKKLRPTRTTSSRKATSERKQNEVDKTICEGISESPKDVNQTTTAKKGTRNEEKKSESNINDHRVQTDEIDPAEVNSKATAVIFSKEELGFRQNKSFKLFPQESGSRKREKKNLELTK